MNVRLVDEVYWDLRTARDWYTATDLGLHSNSVPRRP